MSEPTRISAQEARQKVSSGEALLVCAYDDADKFQNNHLEGATSFSEFQSNLPSLAKDHRISSSDGRHAADLGLFSLMSRIFRKILT